MPPRVSVYCNLPDWIGGQIPSPNVPESLSQLGDEPDEYLGHGSGSLI